MGIAGLRLLYALNRRAALSRFVTDGRLGIDNNIAENAMRCIVVGRKNYLFAGSDAGGEKAAAIYTIVPTAKLNEVNPGTYVSARSASCSGIAGARRCC